MSQRFIYPSLMDLSANASITTSKNVKSSNLDVVVHDNEDDGFNNAGLEIYNEFVGVANRELVNRELVNLENAAVNIDNSSDVIIGPVTQFNVNGNVTIYQGKDGQPVGINENSEIPDGFCKDQSSRPPKEEQDVSFSKKRKFTLKFYLGVIISLFLLAGITVILFFQLRKNIDEEYDTSFNNIGNSSLGNHRIIFKKDWNGRIITDVPPMKSPVDLVVVRHTGGGTCKTIQTCSEKMVTLQSRDISERNMVDIYFNFAVGGDGNIYEGRGWNAQPGEGNDRIDLVMIGNFALDLFTSEMISASKALLELGLKHEKLTKNYRLINHNQIQITMSPGKNVIAEVQKWSHYDGRNYIGEELSDSSQGQS